MAFSYMFLFSLSSNECETKEEVIIIQLREVSGWARKTFTTCSPSNVNFTDVIVHRYVTVLMYLEIKSNTRHYITNSHLIWSLLL